MFIYNADGQRITFQEWTEGVEILPSTVWIDLLNPTREEELAVEKFLGIPIPTREEMNEIEVSNRLYEENDALFMTATMLTNVSSGAPDTHAATFIITKKCFVTVRYIDTTSFRRFSSQFVKTPPKQVCAANTFLALVEVIVNRQADILERVDREIDRITRDIFRHRDAGPRERNANYQPVLEQVGRAGDITAKTHESLVTFSRIVVYAGHHEEFTGKEYEAQLTSIRRDIAGLSDHGNHLAARANFLLDATLGMISIQQNAVFKVLSVSSLIFLPPTLVAGIYGMNFKMMPELDWHYGYPIAIILMIFAAILPYAYLRQRKWL